MSRYIDADKLKRDLIDNRCFYPVIVKKAIESAPTADVVPRSECEKWYAEYHKVKEDLKQEKIYHRATEKLADKYLVELKEAKQKVAREIFEEIENARERWKSVYIRDHYGYGGDAFGYLETDVDHALYELKKKYIGE